MSEAARGAIEDGFLRVCLSEIVSMTVIGNLPSRRVMERLGMEQSIELEHPSRSTPKADEGDMPKLTPSGHRRGCENLLAHWCQYPQLYLAAIEFDDRPCPIKIRPIAQCPYSWSDLIAMTFPVGDLTH